MNKIKIIIALHAVSFCFMALSMDSDVKIPMEPKSVTVAPQQPPLLNLAGVQGASAGGTTPKTPVKDFSQLQKSVSVKQTSRTVKSSPVPPSKAVSKKLAPKPVASQMSSAVTPGLLQQAETVFAAEGKKIFQGTNYSEADVWKIVQSLSPVIHAFAQKEGLSLEQTINVADQVKDLDIGHQVFMQLAHGNLNPDLSAPSLFERARNFFIGNPKLEALTTDFLDEQYEKIIKGNPDQYLQLACEAVKSALDLTEGKQPQQSTIATTHIAVQNTKINEQDATIRQQYLAMALQLMLTIGGWVLGIFQSVSPTDCHHNATA